MKKARQRRVSRVAVTARATPAAAAALAQQVEAVVARTPIDDIHTHLYDPALSGLLLWGIDELLVYHYLVAELFRQVSLPYDRFWSLPKPRQAELVWATLFLEHSPVSEACRGVLTTLHRLGLDVRRRDLPSLRCWFARQPLSAHVDRVLAVAGLASVCMTNSPFDDEERPRWEEGFRRDERFRAALRIDPLLLDWATSGQKLARWGFAVGPGLTPRCLAEVRRFLELWTRRLDARYVMVSFGPEFAFPGRGLCAQLIEKAVLPHCRDHGLPLALMLGVKRAVNPQLRLAGDGVGRSDLQALENLCAGFPANKFLVTALARENQHELAVLARKFRNLHLFGCWWFTNIPLLTEEITRLRLELLGLSVTPQHSDARVLEQVVYKWDHYRSVLARVLTEKYRDLVATGWDLAAEEIERDVQALCGGAFARFCRGGGGGDAAGVGAPKSLPHNGPHKT